MSKYLSGMAAWCAYAEIGLDFAVGLDLAANASAAHLHDLLNCFEECSMVEHEILSKACRTKLIAVHPDKNPGKELDANNFANRKLGAPRDYHIYVYTHTQVSLQAAEERNRELMQRVLLEQQTLLELMQSIHPLYDEAKNNASNENSMCRIRKKRLKRRIELSQRKQHVDQVSVFSIPYVPKKPT